MLDGKDDVNGVSLFDDETILGNLDVICGRMKQLLEIIGTLRQFSKLAKDSSGLPRPRLEDIPTGQPVNEQHEDEHIARGECVSFLQNLIQFNWHLFLLETYSANPKNILSHAVK